MVMVYWNCHCLFIEAARNSLISHTEADSNPSAPTFCPKEISWASLQMRNSNQSLTGSRQLPRPHNKILKEITLSKDPEFHSMLFNSFTLKHLLKKYYLFHCNQQPSVGLGGYFRRLLGCLPAPRASLGCPESTGPKEDCPPERTKAKRCKQLMADKERPRKSVS